MRCNRMDKGRMGKLDIVDKLDKLGKMGKMGKMCKMAVAPFALEWNSKSRWQISRE